MKRKIIVTILISAFIFTLNGCTNSDDLNKQISEVQEEIDKQADALQEEIDKQADALQEEIDNEIDQSLSENDTNKTDNASETVPEQTTADIPGTETSTEYDELQQLYLEIDSEMSYSEMINLIQSTGLPYSEEKYNGSRVVQVAFTDESTAQKYNKENGSYLEIIYVYPKDENSNNDILEKYSFGTCIYSPTDCSLTLINHASGYYFSYYEEGKYISSLGTDLELDKNMSKEQQLEYYFANR